MLKKVLLESIMLVYNYLWDQNLLCDRGRAQGFFNSLWQKVSSFLPQEFTEIVVAYRAHKYWSLCLVFHLLYKLRGKYGFFISSHMDFFLSPTVKNRTDQSDDKLFLSLHSMMFWSSQSDFLTLWCTGPPSELCQGRLHVWVACPIFLGDFRTEGSLYAPKLQTSQMVKKLVIEQGTKG